MSTSSVQRLRFGLALAHTVLLAGLLLPGCKGQPEEPTAAEIPVVSVEAPKFGILKRTILQPGYAKPLEQTPIYARVQGYVDEVKVDIGDRVDKGKTLATLFVPELKQEWKAKSARVDQARAQVKQAAEGLEAARANVEVAEAHIHETKAAIDKCEAELQRWQSEYERALKFFKDGVYDRQTLDEQLYQVMAALAGLEQATFRHKMAGFERSESDARANKADADLAAARASVDIAVADAEEKKVWYDYRTITAPYTGVVTLRKVHPGQFLQVSSSGSTNKSAEPLFNFVNMDTLRILVQVPEYDAPLVKADQDFGKGKGSPAVISFQGLNDKKATGTVTRKADALDNQARTLAVEIHLDNKDRKYLPGMYVNAAIDVETANTWMLPVTAVFSDGDKSYCFVVEPTEANQGKAVKMVLQLGVANDAVVEVLKYRPAAASAQIDWKELSGQEKIVAKNPEGLLDGQIVRLAP